MQPVRAVVGLGSNLGDRAQRLRDAFAALARLPRTRLLETSVLYRTPAWGMTEQPDFLNAAAALDTLLPPRALLDALLSIEAAAGRERTSETRWGPRTLDLDLLLYGDSILDEPGLLVPHPRLHVRAFALVPLLDVAPDAMIPGHGRARDALAALETMAGGETEAVP